MLQRKCWSDSAICKGFCSSQKTALCKSGAGQLSRPPIHTEEKGMDPIEVEEWRQEQLLQLLLRLEGAHSRKENILMVTQGDLYLLRLLLENALLAAE